MADIFPESREEEILVSTINGEEYDKAPESRIEALLLELKEVIEEGGGGGGTTNYNLLQNKPSINSVTLTGDKSLEDLSIPTAADLAGKQDVLPVTASGNDVAFNGDIQDGQGNTLSVLAEALTKTASGNPVVITDCAGGKARSLITAINAIQDLHGYDKPWVGGAGKNKLPYDLATMKSLNTDGTWSDNVYTYGGVSFTVTDGVVYLSGTSTELILFYIAPNIDDALVADASYILTGAIDANIQVGISQKGFDSGSGLTFVNSFTVSDPSVRINIASGVNTNGKVVKPMIRLATESDASFAPYSNICPISGRTEAVITRSDGDEISEDFTIQLGTTVYGADINWDTGVATVTDVIVDLGSLTYNKDTTTRPADGATINAFYATLSGAKKYGNTEVADIKCSQYVAASVREVDYGGYDSIKNAIIGGDDSNSRIWIYDSQYASYTKEAFKAAMSGVQLCYELATATTIQLTPTQLEMLKGYNRVTVESGTITLDYIAKAISGNDEEIAPLVGDKATKSYAVNDFIERNDGLYRVTAPIASGASFTANNTVKMSIGEALTYLYNK